MGKGMESSIGQPVESAVKAATDGIQMFLRNQNGAGGGGSGGGGGDGGGKGGASGGGQGDKYNEPLAAQNLIEGLKHNIYA